MTSLTGQRTENREIEGRGRAYLPSSQLGCENASMVGQEKAYAAQTKAHLKSLLEYGCKRGLPNLTPLECFQRLRAL